MTVCANGFSVTRRECLGNRLHMVFKITAIDGKDFAKVFYLYRVQGLKP